MTTALSTEFATETTTSAPEANLPQKAGRRLWGPMFLMALVGFAVGLILAIVRANEISTGGDADTIAGLGQLVPGFMFLGFASVFAAISFAIARILGAFREGGGRVQEAVGVKVKTLQMPTTAKVFIVLMAMAMMLILAAVVLHWILGGAILGGSASALANSQEYGVYLEAARRFGAALYLFAIAFGLASIIQVIRYQSIRIREVVADAHRE